MEKTGWKITAITFIVLFLTLVVFFIWSYTLVAHEEKQLIECYYDICSEYPYAEVEVGVCFCYDYDMLGQLVLNKTEIMK